MKKNSLKKISKKKVQLIKLRNRKGYAALCLENLTEGKTSQQALERLKNPLKRMGYELE